MSSHFPDTVLEPAFRKSLFDPLTSDWKTNSWRQSHRLNKQVSTMYIVNRRFMSCEWLGLGGLQGLGFETMHCTLAASACCRETCPISHECKSCYGVGGTCVIMYMYMYDLQQCVQCTSRMSHDRN